MDKHALLDRIKTRLEAVYGERLRGVVLYGSEARGDAGPDSDIDVLVLLAGPVALGKELRVIIDALYPLQLEMDRVLEAIPVDEADYHRGEYAFYRNVQKEGIHA
jgi:predicted nucleotidyltransferase